MTYSSSLAMGRQRYNSRATLKARRWGRNQNTTSFRAKEATLGPVSNTIILIVLACLLVLLYLTQVTKTNAFGYQINELQEQQSSLESEHDELQVESARLQSQDRIKNSQPAQELVSVAPSSTIQN